MAGADHIDVLNVELVRVGKTHGRIEIYRYRNGMALDWIGG